MGFSDILAQESAVETLKRAMTTGRVSHAYIFSGPSGVGKHLAADALATALNCRESPDDSCGGCSGCRKIAKGIHPDVFTVSLPAKKKSIPVDTIRELERRLAMRPHEGDAKVAIIDPADRMTEAAANALLKTLEEPKPGRFLILISSRLSSMLATVRSRCQVVRFNGLPDPVVQRLLIEMGAAETDAPTAAAFAMGSLDRARAYLEEDLDDRIDELLLFLESAVDDTPLKGLEVVESKRRGPGGARDAALSLIDLAPTLLSEILAINTQDHDTVETLPLVRLLGRRVLDVADKLSVAQIASFTFGFHKAQQAILNNNMNPQLALESVLMSTRNRGGDPAIGSEQTIR